MTLVDPVSETISQATFQTLNNLAKQAKLELPLETLKSRQAPEIIAEVLAEPQQLLWKDVQENCQVIEYRNDSVTGRTWVRISDGKVLQQEATGFGEKLKLVRDN